MAHAHTLDLTGFSAPKARPFHITRDGWNVSPEGHRIDFTDYYMTYDGRPFFGVSAEFHFSRLDSRMWDKELAKLKDAGVNVVSTYVFWNHHEARKGVWDFTGRRNLRRFVELCARHGLFVIVRMGPFDHGEVRNGGIPDWVFSQPCEARSTDPAFLALVKDLYGHIAAQLSGLYFKDGGPIIAAQLDNEYMHSSAPWEFLDGVTEEWVPGGHEGFAYIEALRALAEQCGVAVPFYTNTGWGGAPVPDDVLPLWGGYPYRPWLFYAKAGEHPLTDEYLYRDYHSDDVPRGEEFDPSYAPSTRPYACCEMGGGMMVSYKYRFVLPMKSVDAMANVKMASGCNFLGYYMLQGGSNPIGGESDGAPSFLNENQVPKVSYDYQAPFGEFGQVRQSARRLRLLHLFATTFADRFVPLPVALPDDQKGLDQHDLDSLRWSVRTDGQRGFVFIDNFQDHAHMPAKKDEQIRLTLADGSHVDFDGIGLAPDENTVLPFNMDLDGVGLVAATVQPVTVIRPAGQDRRTFVFLRPEGMTTTWMRFADGTVRTLDPSQDMVSFDVEQDGHAARILVLSRALADRMTVLDGTALAFVESQESEASACARETVNDDVPAIYTDRGTLVARTVDDHVRVETYPTGVLGQESASFAGVPTGVSEAGGAAGTTGASGTTATRLSVTRLHEDRWILTIPDRLFDDPDLDELVLRLDYRGDIGWLFAGTRLLDDNFCNGDPWEIGLWQYRQQIQDADGRLVLVITPRKEGSTVNVESAMAARLESSTSRLAELDSAELRPVRTVRLRRKG
jgi:hypothetical protein